ncbi:WYL domain-containing protein [Candidatus Kaistella beijingensis]|uniref:helix-turn-helix transcriptional regulator n=1 Tax=Candidatus Kaistella beijingensis TaxID=2820270 RepID=UPI001CC63873|nr:WYL domain-containing protein [Candidatus Kaistella beijingensis]UBB90913.1 WYL domain-containing protein [Candidatus Kaistella beijingensis]
MATNKNAVLRYKILDSCFSNPYRKFFISDLIKICGEKLSEHFGYEVTVSRRTILDDIKFMRSLAGYDAPIISVPDGKKVYYQYEDPDFSILKKPLSTKEMESLNEALQILNRMKNLPGFDWVDSISAKINSGLDLQHSERKIISFEENEFLVGTEFLSPLYQSILNKNALKVSYKSFRSEKPIHIIFSPQYLKQYNNRWFVFGENHEFKSIQNLALDRIKKLSPSKHPYCESTVDFEEYFEDIIGVTNDLSKKPIKVIIELSDQVAPYIVTKPMHGSQKIKDNILTLNVKHNQELETLLLSYGERIKILEPQSLVDALKLRVSDQHNHYFK